MKKILCYGDSNTYGFIPGSCGRYKKNERWSGILAELLPEYYILEEGMNNRTAFFKNPEGLKYSGGEYLPIYLQNHKDIDICILSLGTNDAQFFYDLDETIAKQGLEKLINSIYYINPNTKIILISPVNIQNNILKGIFVMQFDIKSIEKIKKIIPIYEQFAKEKSCYYLNINSYVKPSELDGLHYSKDSHKIIAQVIANFIKEKV